MHEDENLEHEQFDFTDAENLIDQVQVIPAGEDEAPEDMISDDEAERGARSIVKGGARFFNWIMRTFKDPRIQWTDEIIEQAQDRVAPALAKHGVGSGVGKYSEEAEAVFFMGGLFSETYAAVKMVKEDDAKKAKEAEAGQQGFAGQSQNEAQASNSETAEGDAVNQVLALPSGLGEQINFAEGSESGG